MKVLIVEDDAGISSFVKLELEHEGFKTSVAETGRSALELFEKEDPDIILLDIMLPELSGLEVLRRIRKDSTVPVILLTACGETYDKVNGLNAGADDYLAKPFEIEELLARMRAVLRRTNTNPAPVLQVSDLKMDLNSMKVTVNEQEINLSRTEYMLLKLFMENTNVVLSRENILASVWGREHYIDENVVDVYVGYLRTKIDKMTGKKYITTQRGSGYMLKGEE